MNHGGPARHGATRLGDLSPLGLFAAVLAGYMALAFSAYELFGALSIGVTFFPPAGLTYACCLAVNRHRWPLVVVAIVVGEVSVNLVEAQPFWWSFAWAGANAVEPLAGAAVTRALVNDVDLDRSFAKGLAGGGLIVGPAAGATCGATILAIHNDFDWFSGWIDVWVGDALGVLVVAPAVLAFVFPVGPYTHPSRLAITMGACLLAAMGVLYFTIDDEPFGYAAIPLLGWVTLVLGARGLAVVVIVVASVSTAATARGHGPWSATTDLEAHDQLVHQQVFLLVAIGGAWLLAIEVRRRTGAVEQAALARGELEKAAMRMSLVDRIQRAFLPPHTVSNERVVVAGYYSPASEEFEIGGDWYDMTERSDGKLDLIVGDVVGHSVDAAVIMGQLSSASRAIAACTRDPAEAIGVLDDLAGRLDDARGSTLVFATFDPVTAGLRYARAGHPPPLVRCPDGRVLLLEGGHGPPLTCAIQPRYHGTVELEPGCMVLMYTDGIIERRGAPLRERLDLLAARFGGIDSTDPAHIVEELVRSMTEGSPPTDDIALLCIAVLEPANAE